MTSPAFEPVELLYRTQITRDRPGVYGTLMQKIAAHPIISGFVGGALAVGVALWRGWKGASTMPEAALVLCVLVMLVWVVLFYFMRGFFAAQTTEVVEVVRKLQVSREDGLLWTQGHQVLCQVTRPVWRLCRATGEAESDEHPWCVWVIVTDRDDPGERLDKPVRFALETRVMWREARLYPMESHERDELLPSHVASPLLERARAAMS